MRTALPALLCLVLLAGCQLPGQAAPVVKLGLIAPFEGLGRPLGYAVLPAVKIAVAEANAGGELGRYRIALVALNDDDDPQTAAAQVAALAVDPDVMAAIAGWSTATAAQVAPALGREGMPALVAAPLAEPSSQAGSVCPSVAEIAAALAARAGAGSSRVAGPANALTAALVPGSVYTGTAGTLPDPVAACHAGDSCPGLLLYSGDAAQAASDLARWRAAGWPGQLAGGPDLVRPWFVERAGAAAEGTLGLACAPKAEGLENFRATYQQQVGSPPGPQAVEAYAATRAILAAMAQDVATHGRPSRAGTAVAMTAVPVHSQLVWFQVRGGQWSEMTEKAP